MGLLGQLSFGAPWILAALVAPARDLVAAAGDAAAAAARRLSAAAPAARPEGRRKKRPARTPWWLLLLRLIAAALLIVALADPLLGRAPQIAGTGPLVLVVDNGWTAAHGWDERQAAIADVLRPPPHDGRAVVLIATADAPDTSLLDAGEAAATGAIRSCPSHGPATARAQWRRSPGRSLPTSPKFCG